MQRSRPHKKVAKKKRTPVPVFLATTIVVFFLSLSTADSIGFVPDYIDGTTPTSADTQSSDSVALSNLPQLGVESASPVASTVLPEHITIESVGLDLPVQNPSTTNVDALDNLLKQGPAHYAPSANLDEAGNLIIFAHSSHLPDIMIHNKMYQAFNQIPNVQSGASISILGSDGKTYLYSVDSVVKASTNDGTTIPLSPAGGTKLTLVTCDTLTGVSARFILTASFVGTD
jgi:sortase (surface protein transpeptidase)